MLRAAPLRLLEGFPQRSQIGIAVLRTDGERAPQDRADRRAARGHALEHARAVRLVGGRDEELRHAVAGERPPPGRDLDDDQGHREDVCPGAGDTVSGVELFGGAVLRCERLRPRPRLEQRPRKSGSVGQDFGDPEIEDLEERSAPRPGEKEVRGLHVAVGHALLVSDRERLRDGGEQTDRLAEPAWLGARSTAALHLGGERLAFEPFHDEVRCPRAVRRCGGAGVHRQHDRPRLPRESVQELRLALEPPHQIGALVVVEGHGELEAFHGHGRREADVLSAVDDALTSLAGHGLYDEPTFDGRSHPPERIGRTHARPVYSRKHAGDREPPSPRPQSARGRRARESARATSIAIGGAKSGESMHGSVAS